MADATPAPTPPKPRIALYFSGRVRRYESQLDALLNLQRTHDMDFFCAVNAPLDDYHAKFLETFGVKKSHFETFKMPEEWRHRRSVTGNVTHNVSSMFYNNLKAMELIEAYQNEHGFVYDLVIKYRSDIVAKDLLPISSQVEPGTLYIPEHFDYNATGRGAINDQLAYGDFHAMQTYSGVYARLGEYLRQNVPFHPETLLYHHLRENGLADKIRRFPFAYSLNHNRRS